MTDLDPESTPDPFDRPTADPVMTSSAGVASSKRWRSLWRIHFYAGMFSMPFILLMAVTGLVILYTQPLQDATQGDVRTVTERGEWVSFDEQAAAAQTAYPDAAITSMTMPNDGRHATIFGADDGSAAGLQVFVDPYTSEVLGTHENGGDLVGLSNRLHGFLNSSESFTVDLPSVGAVWDDGPVMRPYVVGDLVLEILGVWTLVLALSGLYLWWPRRSNAGGTKRTGRRFFALRVGKKGRARWRDLHGLSGVALLGVLLITIVSGMGWSTYWGPNFTALANEISPNAWTDAPASPLGERGDLDRQGNQIPWNTGDRPIPASYATAADGTEPAPISLDTVVGIGADEGMKPGYTVHFPANDVDEAANPIYGSFTLSNSWPRKTGEARDLFVDQFSGASLDEMNAYGYGGVSYSLDVLVSTHMGTQLGIVSRLFMTVFCVLAIWSVLSAFVMFWKRRRPGTAGLPRRPVDVRLERNLAIGACVLAVVFPQWGITALLVLAFDRFVIRRVRPLRVAFGQR